MSTNLVNFKAKIVGNPEFAVKMLQKILPADGMLNLFRGEL